MRVTQNMISRNYMASINNSLTQLHESQERITSGRKFTRISQNVADGMRSLRIRKQLEDNGTQQSLIRDAKGVLSSAESNLKSINEIMITARGELLKAKNGTNGEDDRANIAKSFDSYINEILQFMNSQYADSFLFSGTNNGTPPFKLDGDKLVYNGTSVKLNDDTGTSIDYMIGVDELIKNDPAKSLDPDAKYMIKNPYFDVGIAAPDTRSQEYLAVEIPMNSERYVDLGMGYDIKDQTGNYEVDPRTAFQISFDGLGILGFGTSKVKVDDSTAELPNNLYSLLKKAKEMLEDPEKYSAEDIGAMCDHMETVRQDFFMNVTEIGNRDNFLDQRLDALETEEVNLRETRSNLEGTNDYQETMNVKMFEYCWLATLKMGNKILPQSLMDFIQ